jgi:hypothetical protein
MSRCVRRGCAAAACVFAAVVFLGSCEFPGFLGEEYELSAPLFWDDIAGVLHAYDGKDDVVTFSMALPAASPIEVFVGALTSGIVSVHFGTPPSAALKTWVEIMPIAPTVSDSAALGTVINVISKGLSSYAISCRNPAETRFAYWAYSDSDVSLAASGATMGPGGVSVNMSMDIKLKKGWNIIILDRTGTAAPFTDTYTVGDMPTDLSLIWDGEPK